MSERITKKEFGEFIKNMRTSIKWNRIKLGEYFGVCHTTIGRWERGTHEPGDVFLFEQKLRSLVKSELKQKRKYKVVRG